MEKGITYTTGTYKLDIKDLKIINALWENGRYTIAQISKKTNIQRDSVMYRLKKLLDENVITGFNPVINPPALGYPNMSLILIKVKISNSKDIDEFEKKLIQMPNIAHIAKLLGRYDFQINIIYKDLNELYKLIDEIKLIKQDFIQEIEQHQMVSEPKYDNLTGLVNKLVRED